VKKGEILGVLYFASNYTQSIATFKEDFFDYSDDGSIQVHLDQTDLQKTSFIKRKLYESFDKFMGKILVECGKSRKAGGNSFSVEAAYGEMSFDLRQSIVPGFILRYKFRLLNLTKA
jgi:hypothetical protein